MVETSSTMMVAQGGFGHKGVLLALDLQGATCNYCWRRCTIRGDLGHAAAVAGLLRQGCAAGCAGEVCAPGKGQGVGWRPAVVLAAGRREGDRFRFRFRFRINLRI